MDPRKTYVCNKGHKFTDFNRTYGEIECPYCNYDKALNLRKADLMIKVWHEECKGKGIIERHGHYLQECTNCNGKGYTEHEGNLEDLELAAAVKLYFEQVSERHSMALESGGSGKVIAFNKQDLLDWYKEQKGGNL